MMNTLRPNINNPEVKEIIEIIEKVAKFIKLDFFLIGARARDLWFEAHKLFPGRATMDIDFAVLVPDIDKFEEFKSILVSDHGFKINNVPHRIIYEKNDFSVDLLPFGEIGKANYMELNDSESTVISILGFNEVYLQIIKDGYSENDFKIASLAGLCVLKLIAWNDRPAEREKDIIDFAIIASQYFNIFITEIYESHSDLFVDIPDTILVGCRVLGMHIKRITERNDILEKRIIEILSKNSQNIGNSAMGDIMARQHKSFVENAVAVIKEVLKGIQEG